MLISKIFCHFANFDILLLNHKGINMKKMFLTLIIIISWYAGQAQLPDALKWHKYELVFNSSITYTNPVQEVKYFEVAFTSPNGIKKIINGF